MVCGWSYVCVEIWTSAIKIKVVLKRWACGKGVGFYIIWKGEEKLVWSGIFMSRQLYRVCDSHILCSNSFVSNNICITFVCSCLCGHQASFFHTASYFQFLLGIRLGRKDDRISWSSFIQLQGVVAHCHPEHLKTPTGACNESLAYSVSALEK